MGRSPVRRSRSPRRDHRSSRGGGGGGGDRNRDHDRSGRRESRGGGGSPQRRKSGGTGPAGGGSAAGRAPVASPTQPVVTGKQKAKEAMEKEREKARLKKLEREQALAAKTESKAREREARREQLELALAPVSALGAAETGGGLTIPAQSLAEQEAEASKAKAAAARGDAARAIEARLAAGADAGTTAAALDEVQLRKLFDLLDRNSKAQASPRNILVALRKHPPVRRLFGLPVTEKEDDGSLERRLLSIQDAFEAGSGLGEVDAVLAGFRAAAVGSVPAAETGSSKSLAWEEFRAGCQAPQARSRALAAIALLPREHVTGSMFVATAEWAVVPPGAACPGGLEYKMDIDTGRTLARLLPTKK
eukprot:TRINITY_DN45664_c0_g1_i1.p1 TRINITY_DN45664_c0_g1~~TRINITY_DN45664_c0_g1_i1.p1  ORF type:complete len:394 (+),score=98.36 TRINITY_DN45664_c0_g1_i1:95-1183(+)